MDLTAQRWSEYVWLTGLIDRARLEAVSAALEEERASHFPEAPDGSGPDA
jgi:hypothetical protein